MIRRVIFQRYEYCGAVPLAVFFTWPRVGCGLTRLVGGMRGVPPPPFYITWVAPTAGSRTVLREH